MNEQIMAFEQACKITYNSKREDKTYGPDLWMQKAIQDKLYKNHNGGFTRMNNARNLVADINTDDIIYSFIDVMIKLYDEEVRFGKVYEHNVAAATVHLINSNNGMEDLIEQIYNGIYLAEREYNGEQVNISNEANYFKNNFKLMLSTFVSSNMTFDLLACNTKLRSLDAQKALYKFQEFMEKKHGNKHIR